MLLAYNMTTSPVTIVGKRSVVLPASSAGGTRGAATDVTSELRGLTNAQYLTIEGIRVATTIQVEWTGSPEFDVTGLTVAAPTGALTVANTTAVNNTTAATVTPVRMAGSVSYPATTIAAELVSVVNAVLPADGAQVIAAQPDQPRKLQVRVVTGSTAGTFTLVGIGKDGEAVTEAFDISTVGGTRTLVTAKAFATLTSATVTGINTPAGTIGIGVGNALALPACQVPAAAGYTVYKANLNGANEAVGTVDAAAGTIEPTTAPNAARAYQFFYTYTVTPVSPAHTHTQVAHLHALV